MKLRYPRDTLGEKCYVYELKPNPMANGMTEYGKWFEEWFAVREG